MLKYLVPTFPIKDMPILIGYAILGALIAGAYGIVHDHVTYSICPEYFTNFKFEQFEWANLGLGNFVFVSCIGFLATWWVGLIVAWILARRMLPHHSRHEARRKILFGFGIVFCCVLAAGMIGYLYGLYRGPDGDYSGWQNALNRFNVSDVWSFMRVSYIHNAGYIGGVVGHALTFFLVRPDKAAPEDSDSNELNG